MSVFVPGGDDGDGIVGVQGQVDLGGSVLRAVESWEGRKWFCGFILHIVRII